MKKNKILKLVDEESKSIEFLLAPVIDQLVEESDLSGIQFNESKTEDEKKNKYRELVFDFIIDKEGLYRINHGFDLIIENMDRVPGGQIVRNELTEQGIKMLNKLSKTFDMDQEKIIEDLKRTRSSMLQNFKSKETSTASVSDDPFVDVIALRKEWGISDQAFDVMYKIGCLLFSEQHVEEATSVFHFLSILDVKCHEVWFSIALCYQKRQSFNEANVNYALAIITNPENVHGYINSAVCYKAAHDLTNAKYMLELAETVVEKSKMNIGDRTQALSYIKEQNISILQRGSYG